MTKLFSTTAILLVLFFFSCKNKLTENNKAMDSTESAEAIDTFGIMPEGTVVKSYTLLNKNKMEMAVINYGGIITSLKVPDKNGVLEDVVLGFDSLDDYLNHSPYFGAIIGRYGNRIANGKFQLDGKEYSLAQNNNGQHLHGGPQGFDKQFWNVEPTDTQEGKALKLTYVSEDMQEGYPGNLSVEVIYILTDNNELKIYYSAKTDKKTIINLTQHSYFNLSGNTKADILSHQLEIRADQFVPINKVLIPTGRLQDVAGTPFDFRTSKTVGANINDKDEQLINGLGYDHCWVLSSKDKEKFAAALYDPASGRVMKMYTTEPGVQFYSGNFLDGTLKGKYGVTYKKHYGLCLESEHFPDSPNQHSFPSVVLNPGETYKTYTMYAFEVVK
jgi:aldose 1-epimerase